MLKIFIGLLAGLCTGLGLGGSSVLIMLLVLILNFDQRIAQATNIICFIPSALTSIFINIKNKNIKFKLALPVVLFGITGAIIGAGLSIKINVNTLRRMFGFFLIIVSLNEFYSIIKPYIKTKKRNTISYK